MWVLYALASAVFAGIVSILAKIGIQDVDSNVATALRTVVVVFFAWLMVFVVGSHTSLPHIDSKSLLFLVLSGLATGGSWLCYFKALQIGDVNKVVPVDKSSTILTMLLSLIFLGEGLTLLKVAAMVLIGTGTYWMIERKSPLPPASASISSTDASQPTSASISSTDASQPTSSSPTKAGSWLLYAVLSAFFASLTAILGKVGITGVESNLGTTIRTIVVLIMAWLMVFGQRKHTEIRCISKRSWVFITLSGLATGFSWLFYYRALQEGPASVVVPIDKLSILVTVAFGYFVLHEKLKKQALAGLLLIVVGTLSLLI